MMKPDWLGQIDKDRLMKPVNDYQIDEARLMKSD